MYLGRLNMLIKLLNEINKMTESRESRKDLKPTKIYLINPTEEDIKAAKELVNANS